MKSVYTPENEKMPPYFPPNYKQGNIQSKIYHIPGGVYYDRTNTEVYFATEEEAVQAGYRKSLK